MRPQKMRPGKSILPCQSLLTCLIKGLVCSKEPRMVCLPTLNNDSLFTILNMYRSFVNPKFICKENPCPSAQRPFLDDEGVHGCTRILTTTFLNDLKNNKKKCKKSQVLRQGKCVSRFFGRWGRFKTTTATPMTTTMTTTNTTATTTTTARSVPSLSVLNTE